MLKIDHLKTKRGTERSKNIDFAVTAELDSGFAKSHFRILSPAGNNAGNLLIGKNPGRFKNNVR
jgi:hypothetical protein